MYVWYVLLNSTYLLTYLLTYLNHKLPWVVENSLANVVRQARYDSLSRTKEFTHLTDHYDVVIRQRTPNDIRNNIINSFTNTVMLMAYCVL